VDEIRPRVDESYYSSEPGVNEILCEMLRVNEFYLRVDELRLRENEF
jgi:hypothetical protein